MVTQLRTMGLGMLVATVVSLSGATNSFADPMYQPRLRPLVPPPVASPVVPRLGIMGHIEYRWGMVVDSVVPGTTAHRMGLERGDVILRINGQDVSSDWSYRQALVRAVQFENGLVRMQIADVRSGQRVFRTGYLHMNPGVVRPWSAPRVMTPYTPPHHHHNGPGLPHAAVQQWKNEAW